MRLSSTLFLAAALSCSPDPAPVAPVPSPAPQRPALPRREFRRVLVIVALCDNAHQGIVPVSARLGNGQDPANNLYWGAAYGVKTFFSRSSRWKAEPTSTPITPFVLDHAVFRSLEFPVELVAEAYDGSKMSAALSRFFSEASTGDTDLVCFVGHNGLMDLPLEALPQPGMPRPKGAVVLACKSRSYFGEPLERLGCPPMVTTSGFMAPEAYALEAIVREWAGGADGRAMASAAATAYSKYQKCGISAARRLFVAGE